MDRQHLLAQLALTKYLFDGFEGHVKKGGILILRGKLRPSEWSAEYTVLVEIVEGERTKIFVESPSILDNPRGRPPHLFRDDSLCLWLPWNYEFVPGDSVARKIIPWISLWLWFYEVWVATGDWRGGGEHPVIPGESGKETGVDEPIPNPQP